MPPFKAPPCTDCECQVPTSVSNNTKSLSPISSLRTTGLSSASNDTLSFLHTANDYRLSTSNSGCAPCGGGTANASGLPRVTIERVFAPRTNTTGSFGWGTYLATDLRLSIPTTGSAVMTDPRSSGYDVEFPRDASGQPIITGAHLAKAVKAIDASGALTPLDTATQVVVSGWNDQTLTFDLSPVINGSRRGRLLRTVDALGNTTALTYRFAAADLAADPTDGTRWWAVSRITGPAGDSAVVTTSAAPVGGCYPVTGIALPDGKSLTYSYGTLATVGGTAITALTDVTHPDGTHTTVSGAVTAGGDLAVTLVDPAEPDAAHQSKTVVLSNPTWIDPWTGAAAPWAVREVRNAAGEVVYANLRVATADENWTVISDHGVIYRLVTDGAGGLVRTDQATAAVDWATDPATWPWVTLASYSVSFNSRLEQSQDALGRSPKWDNSPSTGLVMGTTDAANQTTTYTRDAAGHITADVDRLGRRTTYTRDAAGHALTTIRAAGTPLAVTESAVYDALGLRTSSTDGLGRTTNYTYNAAGQVLTETQPPDVVGGSRAVTTYTYDSVGRLSALTDPVGRVTTFAYDARNRLVTTTYGDSTFASTTYGTGADAGRVIATRDRNGNVTTYGYDAAGRRNLTQQVVTRADGSTETLREVCTYVPGSEREASCTRNGETTVYGYDARGRRISQSVFATQATALTTTWTYDDADRRIVEQDPYGRKTFTVYDMLDRVVRTVRETVPTGVPAGAALATLPRLSGADPAYVIEDSSYDAEGQVLTRTDARGTVSSFAYDGLGRVITQIDGGIATTRFTYDAVGNRTRIAHPRNESETGGFATAITYTGRNRPLTITEAVGRAEAGVTSYTYAGDGKPLTVTDPLNRVTATAYTACCGRVAQTIDALGFITAYVYDGNGNVRSVTDPNGLTTVTTFDARNRPLTRTDPTGQTWTWIYDDDLTDGAGLDAAAAYGPQLAGLGFGRDAATGFGADGAAVAVRDPNGNTTVTAADGLGRVVRTVNALRQATTTAYDRIVSDVVTLPGGGTRTDVLVAATTTRADGSTTVQWTDGLGRVRSQIDAEGRATRVASDGNGNRVRLRDPDGVGQDWTYDGLNREISASDSAIGASHGTTATAYDAAGNVVTRTAANGARELSVYDARNRRIRQSDRISAATVFTYDAVGNLLTITDAQGGVTSYGYDARNLLTQETFPGTTGGTRRYAYDAGRRLRARTDQTGTITRYAYDGANRLIARQYPDGKHDTFTYDRGGRLTRAASARYSSTVSRTYDAADRVTRESLTLGSETWGIGASYDALGRLTRYTLPDGTTQDRTYTTRGLLGSVRLAGTTIATREYTPGGRLSLTTSGNTLLESRTYVAGEPLVSTITIPGVTGFSYTYDAMKRKTAEVDLITPSNTQRFTYDSADRLTRWDRVTGTAGPVETAQTWTLSAVGDWTSTVTDGVTSTRTHTPVHEIATIDGLALTHDVKGNLTRDDQGQTFAWDVENRLASAANLVQQPGETSASYAYDALGRRVRKTVGTIQTTWVPWGAQELYELRRNPAAIAADQPPTTPTAGGAVPVATGSTYPSGALVADVNAIRINFQPSTAPVPPGWSADTGALYGLRGNGKTYGWLGTTALTNAVNRDWLGWGLYDTYAQPWAAWATAGSTPATWELLLPNGIYPVAIICGDARSIQQRTDLVVEGRTLLDPAPWNGTTANPTTGQRGRFAVLSTVITVADGRLTLTAAPTAKAPKICAIEIGTLGTTFDGTFAARVTAALATANARTATGRPPDSQPRSIVNAFGTYVDELLGYRVQQSSGPAATRTMYWAHANHLYSVAAVTTASGSVMERWSYNAYGLPTLKNSANATIAKSAAVQTRGFTGYTLDTETGLFAARARMYSAKLCRFISRDPAGYVDGFSLYGGWYVPNKVDPFGLMGNPGPGLGLTALDFLWHYYFGFGSTINLNNYGFFDFWRNAVSSQIKKGLEDQLKNSEPSDCGSGTYTKKVSFSVLAIEDREWTSIPALFIMGGSQLTGEATCTYKNECVDCGCDGRKRTSTTVSCTISMHLRDAFDNPTDIKDKYYSDAAFRMGRRECYKACGPTDRNHTNQGCINLCNEQWPDPNPALFATPYAIVADWTESYLYTRSLPGCSK